MEQDRLENLNGYKVVASKSDSTPSYPENGYLYYITDRKELCRDRNSTAYNTGFASISSTEKYYFAITAVYKDRNVTERNKAKYEGKDFPAPS